MNRIARMTASDRADLFAETADRKGLPEARVEKDFWVCWLLKQLFSINAFSGRLLFKGGTSLSKIFRAINRFSEDVDLAVDYAALGFTGSRDPRQEGISRTKQVKILAEMMAECRRYIGREFLGELVVRHKESFYPSAWARYDLARPGSLRILPVENRISSLKQDYRETAVMIFGEPPTFEIVLRTLAGLEREVNHLAGR